MMTGKGARCIFVRSLYIIFKEAVGAMKKYLSVMMKFIKAICFNCFGLLSKQSWQLVVYKGFNINTSKPTFNIEMGSVCCRAKAENFKKCLEIFHRYTDENKAFAFIAECKFVVPMDGRYYIRSKSKQGCTVSLKTNGGFVAVRNIPGSVKSYLDNDSKNQNTVVGECLLSAGVEYTMQVKYWCIGESMLQLHINHDGIGNDIDECGFVVN